MPLRDGLLVRQPMLRMTHDHHGLAAPGDRSKRLGVFGIADDAQVGVAVLNDFAHAMGVEVLQPHLSAGMLRGEPLHERAHVMKADRVDRRHDEAAGLGVVERADLLLELFVAADNFAAAVVEALAFGSKAERPRRPVEQLHAEPPFERLHNLAGARLRDIVLVGGARKALALDDVAEDFQGFGVHRW